MPLSSLTPLWQAPSRLRPDYQHLLGRIAHLWSQECDAETLCRNIFETLREPFHLDSYAYCLTSLDGTQLNLASSDESEGMRSLQSERPASEEGSCGSVAHSSEASYVSHVQERKDERTLFIRNKGVRCYICHPLLLKGSPIGTLSFGSNRRDEFYPEELELFQLIAQQVKIATERRLQQDYLSRIEQLAAAGRMCATLAHEINNPLASIVNLLYLLRDEVTTDDGKAFLQKTEVQVIRLGEMARRMLDQFRGKQQLPSRVDLSELAQDLAANISLPHQVRLLTHYTGAVHVHALPGEMRQVLFNLLLNAAQFTPPGGDVTLTVRRCGRLAQVMVRDDGPGISEENRVHLFRPFYTTSRDGGTGIGLWISREMIERAGGSLTFVSNTVASPGISTGTEFIITLPIFDAIGDSVGHAIEDAIEDEIGRPRLRPEEEGAAMALKRIDRKSVQRTSRAFLL